MVRLCDGGAILWWDFIHFLDHYLTTLGLYLHYHIIELSHYHIKPWASTPPLQPRVSAQQILPA